MKTSLKIGMLKSRLIYDFKPFIVGRMRKFYSQFIKEGDLCFDLGAHTGNRSLVWLKMGARVVAVEPQPAFLKLLSGKFDHNRNFHLVNGAVGDKQGLAILKISNLHPAISTLSDDWIKVMKAFDPSVRFVDSVETKVTTLDILIKEYGFPQFCKIDVEGYEEKVIKGLSKPVQALSFEFFPTTSDRAVTCINLLEKLGKYLYNWSLIETFRMKSTEWFTANKMKEAILAYDGRRSGDIYAVLQKSLQ